MKTKASLTLLGAMLLSIAIFIGCGTSSKEAYESFSMIMDKTVGAGKWSAAGHEDQLKDGTLIVKGLTLKLPPVELPPALSALEEDGDDQAPAKVERTVNIATVEVKNLASKATVQSVTSLADWRGQKETKLAESLLLKGVSHQVPLGSDVMEMSIEEIQLLNPVLGASGAGAPEGLAGFFKAYRADRLAYKNFKMAGLSNDAKIDLLASEMSADKIAFEGEPYTAFDALDPSGMTGMMMAMSCQNAALKNFSMNMEAIDEEDKAKIVISIDSLEQKNSKGMAIGSLKANGFKFEITGTPSDHDAAFMFPMLISLDSYTMNGLDMSAYFEKMAPVFAAITTDPEEASELLTKVQTLGDLFVSPVSVDDLSMTGFKMSLGEALSIKLAEASAVGPYKAGQIPASQKSSVKGLEIILPSDAKFNTGSTKNMYEFGRQFGMTHFVINGEGVGSYDPKTGLMSNSTTNLSVKDLFSLKGGIEMGGLTKERIDTLNGTPMQMGLFALMMDPAAVMGDISLNSLNIKLDDQGLTERVMAYAAAKAAAEGGTKVELEDMRKITIASVQTIMDTRGKEVLANPEVLSKALVDFYTKPKSLELSLKAEPHLSFKSAMSFGLDQNAILNSLNISISANGEKADALRFDID
ncbi:hypothetical protein LJB99_03740 [Deltaproteobacteria bacterium OttesenSCG-928-K17]|nr:hypothetical protein [Deltaproteobacteria bacterium OttesenSCG-928-K17]